MPKNEFPLEEGGPKRVRIEWKGMFKNVSVQFDGVELGVIPDKKALKELNAFDLPDGSTLTVQFVQGLANTGLEVRRNGRALPGTAGDPGTKFKTAYYVIYFVAGLNILAGVASLLIDSDLLEALGGVFLLGAGIVYLALGLWFHLRRFRDWAHTRAAALRRRLGPDAGCGVRRGRHGHRWHRDAYLHHRRDGPRLSGPQGDEGPGYDVADDERVRLIGCSANDADQIVLGRIVDLDFDEVSRQHGVGARLRS